MTSQMADLLQELGINETDVEEKAKRPARRKAGGRARVVDIAEGERYLSKATLRRLAEALAEG